MSPSVHNFVHDLVAMAQAMEQLPQVQADLQTLRNEVNHAYDTIQRLELKLLDRTDEIDKLNATIRELEVAKDAAETMFLEADDRTLRALEFIKTQFGAAGSLIQALEPAKLQPEPIVEAPMYAPAEPVAVPEGQHLEGSEGQSAVDPTVDTSTSTTFGSGTATTQPVEVQGNAIGADPEPTERWSNDWWQWKDRQDVNVA